MDITAVPSDATSAKFLTEDPSINTPLVSTVQAVAVLETPSTCPSHVVVVQPQAVIVPILSSNPDTTHIQVAQTTLIQNGMFSRVLWIICTKSQTIQSPHMIGVPMLVQVLQLCG